MATVAELAKRLDELEETLGNFLEKIAGIEDAVKVTREVKQVVFEREDGKPKVRAKVVLKKASGTEEVWEDVTEKFLDPLLTNADPEEVLNGA
jgi:ribosomal protein L31E